MLAEKTDEIRRIDAYISEYEADIDFAEHLKEDDEGKYREMQKYQKALVLQLCGLCPPETEGAHRRSHIDECRFPKRNLRRYS